MKSAIVEAAREGHWDAVLDGLLARWRTAPNRELADLIVEIGAHAASAASWEDLDDEPSATSITKLLDGVLEKGSVKARDRVTTIAEWPADPRIDRWVAVQYADPPATSTGARPFWTRLLPLARAITDTQAAKTILKVREGWRGDIPWQAFLSGHVDRAKTKLESAKNVPFAADLRVTIEAVRTAMLASSAAAKPEHHGDASELLDAVLANPADDDARIVLGDVLLEQGDPRGELLALQMGAGDAKRERELVKQHAAHLLGALHSILRDYTFEKGFLSRATIKAGNARALESAIDRSVGDPLWATVEHLEGGTHDLIMDPVMRSLRSLVGGKARLADVSKLPYLDTLATSSSDDAWLALADGLSFMTLRDLDVQLSARHAAPLFDSPLFARLAKLQLRVDVNSYGNQVNDDAFALLPRISKVGPPDATLRFVRYRDKEWHCGFQFAGGTITVTASTNMTGAYDGLVRQDLQRGLAIVRQMPGWTVAIETPLAA